MGDKAKDIADCQRLLLNDAAVGQPPKGKGKGVPQLGDPDGPLIVERGWCKGDKLRVGGLPRSIDKVDIGRLCPGFIDVSVNCTKSRSGHAFAVISFQDSTLAMQSVGGMQWTRLDHWYGQMQWDSVKWFGHQARVIVGPCTAPLIGCAMRKFGVPCCTHFQCI